MAWAQTEASGHMTGMSNVAVKDDDGYWYFEWGPIRVYFGSGGDPDGVIDAPIGSWAVDMATGQWYTKDDATGGTSWEPFSTSIE